MGGCMQPAPLAPLPILWPAPLPGPLPADPLLSCLAGRIIWSALSCSVAALVLMPVLAYACSIWSNTRGCTRQPRVERLG